MPFIWILLGPSCTMAHGSTNNNELTAKFSIRFAFNFFSRWRCPPLSSLLFLSFIIAWVFRVPLFKCGKTIHDSIAMRQKSPLFPSILARFLHLFLARISRAPSFISLALRISNLFVYSWRFLVCSTMKSAPSRKQILFIWHKRLSIVNFLSHLTLCTHRNTSKKSHLKCPLYNVHAHK